MGEDESGGFWMGTRSGFAEDLQMLRAVSYGFPKRGFAIP